MKIHKGTYHLDLMLGKEKLFAKISKDNRWSIRKAEKLGVSFKQGGDKDKAYELYKGICEKNYLISNSKEQVFNHGKLFSVHYNNNLIAFSIVREQNNIATLSYNGSDYYFKHTQANVYLYWKVIEHYIDTNFKIFDLGGVDLNSKYRKDNDRFKSTWEGKLINEENEVSVISWIWWRYLRHYILLQKFKYKVQKFLKTR